MENQIGEASNPSTEAGDIFTLVDEKISNDSEFQESISGLSDQERNQAIDNKKAELINQEVQTLAQQKKKADEVAANYKIRAEKAERKPAEPTATQQADGLTTKDMLSLVGNNIVVEEDVEMVTKYAKLYNKSVSEAIKDPLLKSILADNVEKRKTAQATNSSTTMSRKTVKTPEQILEDSKGSGVAEGDIEALAKARMQARLNKKL